jgi:hypothetical protein
MKANRDLSRIAVLCALLMLALSKELPKGWARQASARTSLARLDAVPHLAARAYGSLPLSFEPNRGQSDVPVKFLSRGNGYTLFLTRDEAVLSLYRPAEAAQVRSVEPGFGEESASPRWRRQRGDFALKTDVLRIQVIGASRVAQVTGLDELPGKSNYFLGNDPRQWRTNIPTYGKVKYRDVYPGVDLVFYGDRRRLEHDFIVAPGASPSSITLGFENAGKFEIDDQGDLILHTKGGEICLEKPRVYQQVEGSRQSVAARYVFKGRRRIGFEVAQYDARKPLIIDRKSVV